MGQVINPYAFAVSSRTLGSIISGGTNIGNMTSGGGLAAAFDGVTSQAGASSAQRAATNDAYVGKTITKRVFKGIFYGSNNHGYVNSSNPNVTLTLMAKQGGAPANSADGTLLGTFGPFTDTADESGNPREIISSDQETLWDHIWGRITHDGSAVAVYYAEAQLYESV